MKGTVDTMLEWGILFVLTAAVIFFLMKIVEGIFFGIMHEGFLWMTFLAVPLGLVDVWLLSGCVSVFINSMK